MVSKKTVKNISDRHINWIDFGIFYGSCMVVCAFSYDEMLAHFKKKKTPIGWVEAFKSTKELWESDNYGFVSKRTVNGCTYFFLILKKRFDFRNEENHTRLAHEILHLASFHLKDFLDPMEENESFCYLHSYLMTQVYKILRS